VRLGWAGIAGSGPHGIGAATASGSWWDKWGCSSWTVPGGLSRALCGLPVFSHVRIGERLVSSLGLGCLALCRCYQLFLWLSCLFMFKCGPCHRLSGRKGPEVHWVWEDLAGTALPASAVPSPHRSVPPSPLPGCFPWSLLQWHLSHRHCFPSLHWW
jgi:hypothetical protein